MKKYIHVILSLLVLIMATGCEEKDLPHVVVTTDAVLAPGTSEATVSGSANVYGGASITRAGFCCSQDKNPTEGDQVVLCSKDAMKVNFTNLQADTHYYVRAFVRNEYGVAYGNEVEFSTQKLPLPIVETLQPRGITENGAIVGGTVTSKVAQVMERGVCYTTSATTTPTVSGNHVVVAVAGEGKYECALTGLTSQKKYYVCAYAINEYGVAYGDVIQFTTK